MWYLNLTQFKLVSLMTNVVPMDVTRTESSAAFQKERLAIQAQKDFNNVAVD